MAVQDKTDFRWNGKLAWEAINTIYYDLINVDATHVPYATMNRNSSFFLKTRQQFKPLKGTSVLSWYTIMDMKIIWDLSCIKESWTAYVMAKKWKKAYIFKAPIEWWCSWDWERIKSLNSEWECRDWKLFTTNYVKWPSIDCTDELWMFEKIKEWEKKKDTWDYTWIQINQYNLWTTVWIFSDENVDSWYYKFKNVTRWDYLLVYSSLNADDSWYAWQVRMITWIDDLWRILVKWSWLWFKTPDSTKFEEWEIREVALGWLKYAIFHSWWEVLWFSDSNNIYLNIDWDESFKVYSQSWWTWDTKILWVASAANKIFILTDTWFVHFSKEWVEMNKFFINDSMDAWTDKSSIVSYRDTVICFWNRHIAVWVPEDKWWSMYNQSTTVWTRSRYSYWEYDWDMILISNDRRLLSMTIANDVGKYMLQFQDVWELLNSKLATLVDGDECYVWDDNNDLRVFVQTKANPYVYKSREIDFNDEENNWVLHIYKFDKQYKVWSEDHIEWLLFNWVRDWAYYWQDWIYIRWKDCWYDIRNTEWGKHLSYKSIINAFLIENEVTWMEWRPDLFMLAKLNRIITTLWPWNYSDNTRIHIQSYRQWIWVDYEFPIWTWDASINNKRIDYITKAYLWEENEIDSCQLWAIQDSQTKYWATCTDNKVRVQSLIPHTPRCSDWYEFLLQDHWVCVNDTLYRFAPTMPLVTSLGENQNYSTQIKLELISEWWDVVSFWWWLAELFIAQLWNTWTDGEYALWANSSC